MISRKFNYLISILFTLVIISCQQSLVKKSETRGDVDSTLFFKQIEIQDPFFEAIQNSGEQKFSLTKKLIPPPQPIPESSKFKEIEGYRVQIFAGVDSIGTISNKIKATQITADTIYFLADKGLYKLQIGDYPYYPQADSVKRNFRQNGYPGAWIVKRQIFIPIKDTTGVAKGEQVQPTVSPNQNTTGKYKIQVIVTGTENKARQICNELKSSLNVLTFYESAGNLFKVFVGSFDDETIARDTLEKIRKLNYTDAWLVY